MSRWSRLVLPALCVASPLGLLSCNVPDFRVASIRPIYGWVDGCTPVSIGGAGFSDDASQVSVTIGDKALENLSLPDAETAPLDVGYEIYGTTPPGAAAGYTSVKVKSGANEGTLNELDPAGPFYYAACPMSAYPEGASPSSGVTSAATITLSGCNLSDSYQVRVGPGQPVALTKVCSTATVTFSAPAMQDNSDTNYPGGYYIAILDGTGAQIFPDPASGCDTTLTAAENTVVDTGGEYNLCDGVPTLTYGAE